MFILERLISIVAPHNCINCGYEGKLLCSWCALDAFAPVPSRCYKCYALTKDSLVCKRCRKSAGLSHVWVATEYEKLAKRLIRQFKFERAQAGAVIIAQAMCRVLPYLDNALVVPIPTASSRQRMRGYDHTKLIAKQLSRLTQQQYLTDLARLNQSRQVGSRRKKRLEQLDGAFWIRNSKLIKNQRILLVDDIVTTGATLEEAAKVLKIAGAKSISAVVFAQSQ